MPSPAIPIAAPTRAAIAPGCARAIGVAAHGFRVISPCFPVPSPGGRGYGQRTASLVCKCRGRDSSRLLQFDGTRTSPSALPARARNDTKPASVVIPSANLASALRRAYRLALREPRGISPSRTSALLRLVMQSSPGWRGDLDAPKIRDFPHAAATRARKDRRDAGPSDGSEILPSRITANSSTYPPGGRLLARA
jgi:hypothetical protein